MQAYAYMYASDWLLGLLIYVCWIWMKLAYIYIYTYIYMVTPHDLPRNIIWELPCFLHIEHNWKNNNLQKGRSWGAGFCTWMFQYIWVVLIISNALLFNGNDWFKTFAWPLHPLVCFTLSSASPFHAANNAYNHICREKTPYFETLWWLELGTWSSKNLGHIEKSKQKLEKQNKIKQNKKNKTFGRMFDFDSKDCFCWFVLVFCFLVLKWTNKKHFFSAFEWIWSNKISKKTKNSRLLLVFQHFRFKVSQNKKTMMFCFPFQNQKTREKQKTIFRVKT